VQALINDRGYTFLDIRTTKEYRSGNKLHWRAPEAAVQKPQHPRRVTGLSLSAASGSTCRWRRRRTTGRC